MPYSATVAPAMSMDALPDVVHLTVYAPSGCSEIQVMGSQLMQDSALIGLVCHRR